MATMIPATCPSRATAGERRLHELLQGTLPDRFTAWYEPLVRNRHPDFALIGPDFGLLVLEVKGWYPGQILRATDQQIELSRGEGDGEKVELHQHPRLQARDYALAAVNELKRPEFAILHQYDGRHRGALCFPFGYGVVLTNITRGQLKDTGLSAVFDSAWTICRDELEELRSAGPEPLLARLRSFFPAYFPFETLTTDQMKTVQGALYREVVVRRRPATAASVSRGQPLLPGAVALDVLDAEQEEAARALGSGHQILFGIAGSGKTVMLLARARMLAAAEPGRRVLVLCFNKALAAYLAAQLDDDPALRGAVEVRHFDSWLSKLTRLRRHPDEDWDAFRTRMVAQVLGTVPTGSQHYDAVLIDEAHDFEPDWFRCVVRFLQGGPQGDLLIALDGAQNLYNRSRKFTWKGVGVQAAGRTRRLDRNYRNTKQILEFAWQVALSPLANEEESETHVRVVPRKASRQGPVPSYRGCETAEEERRVVVRLVRDLRAKGFADSEIAVLHPRDPSSAPALRQALEAAGGVCRLSRDLSAEGLRQALAGPGVRLLTIHAAKGLEFRAVILCGLDLLPVAIEPDQIRDSKLLYVALTRATDELFVTWRGSSAFTDRVLRSNKVVPLGV